jgi:hypothetical protein
MDKNYTPGPWHVEMNRQYQYKVYGPSRNINKWPAAIATLGSPRNVDPTETDIGKQDRANANLISAAPDLLEALQAVIAVADRATDEFDRSRAAIAKALGDS